MQQLIPKIDVQAKYLRIMYFLDLGIFGKNNHFCIPTVEKKVISRSSLIVENRDRDYFQGA